MEIAMVEILKERKAKMMKQWTYNLKKHIACSLHYTLAVLVHNFKDKCWPKRSSEILQLLVVMNHYFAATLQLVKNIRPLNIHKLYH